MIDRRAGPQRKPERPVKRAAALLRGWQFVVGGYALCLAFSGHACAQSSPNPPPLTALRYGEDYSYLADPDARMGTWWEPLKYIPLDESSETYLTLGGEFRLRYEVYKNNNWGQQPAPDDGYLWYRALMAADFHFGPHVRVFGELIGAWAQGKEPFETPVDETGLDLLQGFADLAIPLGAGTVLTLRPGRQILSYGSERLISARYGPNVLRSFDAAKAFVEGNGWRIDGFYGRPVEPGLGDFNDSSDENISAWAAYGTTDLPLGTKAGLDLYYIGYDNEDATFNQGTGYERRHTIGARFFGTAQDWDWNWEAMYQFGTFADGDISAWSVASSTGYTFAEVPLSPHLGLRANIISGDRNPNNPNLQTFNPMFPKGKYFGELTLLGPENLINLHPTLDLQLGRGWSLGGAAVFYWRESKGDGIYDFGGTLIRGNGGSDAHFIGTQAEIVLTYEHSRNLNAMISYSQFYPGRFIKETGPSKTVHFIGTEVQLQF
ncbi:alginate export family protein [Rhodoligotrophos ferricapiens]|uniref:alginate export family protein n=1 Tax=Rhodoligotrophos ferricapiens TaxID=3069264 RepID=UPI00315D1C71